MTAKSQAVLTKTSRVKELNSSLRKLKGSLVMVGIAKGSDKDKRKDGGIDNSDLGWIHENGSPSRNIPARPFLRPGVKEGSEKICSQMEAAMRAALKDDKTAMKAHLERAGMVAVSSVKSYMQTASFAPLADSTLRNRHRSRKTKSRRTNELLGKDVRPLINTGALQQSIDYYVEDEDGIA